MMPTRWLLHDPYSVGIHNLMPRASYTAQSRPWFSASALLHSVLALVLLVWGALPAFPIERLPAFPLLPF